MLLKTVALLVLMTAIFVVDTLTRYEIAVAVFYILAILAASALLPARTTRLLTALAVLLTLTSFALTRHGAYDTGLVNLAISLLAIGITAHLALKAVAARAATERTQNRLFHIARATSLGEMAASIAHEVNQPLAAIATSASACQRWLDQAPPNLERARQAARRMADDAHRASEVIARIRAVTQSRKTAPEAVLPAHAIHETLALYAPALEHEQVRLLLDLPDSLPAVHADPILLQQVLGNLVGNALDALRQVPPGERTLRIAVHAGGNGFAEFAVEDSGCGVTPAETPRLFDPFWTTKDNGAGLGLAIARSIITAHGGEIAAHPAPGRGTRLAFRLPVSKENTHD